MPEFSVILPAAGSSRRFRGFAQKKPFVSLVDEPIWSRAVRAFTNRTDVVQVLLVLADSDRPKFVEQFGKCGDRVELVSGGHSRAESVCNALQQVPASVEYVAVHDAARPLISQPVIDRVFAAAVKSGAAIPGIPVTSTVKQIDSAGLIQSTIDRSQLILAQTPQAFGHQVLLKAYAKANGCLENFTDEASLVEATGHPVTVTEGSWDNIKITTADDFQLLQTILKERSR